MVALTIAAAALTAACSGGGPDPAVLARGELLYEASCVRCHGGPTGGRINDMPPRHTAEGHTWHHPDCLLTEIITDGLPPRPGTEGTDRQMPAFRNELTDDDVTALIEFVRTWWTDEQRDEQAQRTAEQCP